MKKLMLTNAAIARGAYEAGVKVVSSYPGTPSTEITEEASTYKEMYSEWAPNEKVAVEVAVGAAIAGVRSMSAMKHVGLNVAADPVFTAAYTGVNAGLLIVVADDPSMHSSQNEQDSRLYARSAHIPMLEPADSNEAKEFVKLAYGLSEKYDTPVFLRTTTRIAHSQSFVELGEREEITKPYEKNMAKYVMMPLQAKARHLAVEDREKRLSEDANGMDINYVEKGDDLGIVCAGAVYQYVKEALPKASVFKLGMVYPLPNKKIKDFSNTVKRLIVIEELEPFIENQLKANGIACEGKNIFGLQGELSVASIKEKFLGIKANKAVTTIPPRPPVLCAGCPHRGVFFVLNKLKLRVTGDIGCYALGANAPLSAVDTCVCMGASVSMAHGFNKALGTAKGSVAVIGDSTFIHSGITGLINSVYNKGSSTVIILDNSITGMTGHQNNPVNGKTITGDPTVAVNLAALCEAVGVKHVVVVDCNNLKELERVIKEESDRDEVSVIIARTPCMLLSKEVKIPYTVNGCKNCGACLKLGCPAIEKKDNRVEINKELCTACGLCASLCKFSAIEKEG